MQFSKFFLMWVVPKVLWCLITCAIIKTVVKVQVFCSVHDLFKILPNWLTMDDNYFWTSWLPPLTLWKAMEIQPWTGQIQTHPWIVWNLATQVFECLEWTPSYPEKFGVPKGKDILHAWRAFEFLSSSMVFSWPLHNTSYWPLNLAS